MLSGVYRFPPMESVIYGRPFAEAVKEQVEQSGAHAVFLLASGTLGARDRLVGQIRDALGNRLAGVHAKIGAHTPRTDVVAAANAARAAGADLLRHSRRRLGDGRRQDGRVLPRQRHQRPGPARRLPRPRIAPTARSPARTPSPRAVRTVTIPTTLSAGEYTASAGCTDTARNVKESFGHPLMMPKSVILDPRATLHTPEWLFLSTGIRAVDHAVEDICSPQCQPISEGASYHALKLLGRGSARGQGRPARSRRAARLPARRLDVDGRLADRRAEGRQPRHRPCARRHRACAARLHLLRDAAARAALQSRRSTPIARRWSARRWAGPASRPPMSSPG